MIEILVAAALLLLILGLLTQALWYAMRVSTRAMGRVDLLGQAQHSLATVCADFERSQPSAIFYQQTSEQLSLSVHRFESLDPFGGMVWESWLVQYLWRGPTLTRSTRGGVIPGSPNRLTIPELQALEAGDNPKVLGRDVTLLRIEDADPATLTMELPLVVTIELRNQAVTNSVETVRLSRTPLIRDL